MKHGYGCDWQACGAPSTVVLPSSEKCMESNENPVILPLCILDKIMNEIVGKSRQKKRIVKRSLGTRRMVKKNTSVFFFRVMVQSVKLCIVELAGHGV